MKKEGSYFNASVGGALQSLCPFRDPLDQSFHQACLRGLPGRRTAGSEELGHNVIGLLAREIRRPTQSAVRLSISCLIQSFHNSGADDFGCGHKPQFNPPLHVLQQILNGFLQKVDRGLVGST